LQSQLAAKNLPFLREQGHEITFHIYTLNSDIEKFKAYDSYKKASEFIKFEFIAIDNWINEQKNKYLLMTKCHNDSILKCKQLNTVNYLVLQVADMLFSDSVYSVCLDAIGDGKRAVVIFGIPTYGEKMADAISTYHNLENQAYEIEPKIMAQLMTQYMHEDIATHRVDSEVFNSSCPSVLFWKLGHEKFLLRALHMHPLMLTIDSELEPIPHYDTLDGGDFRYVSPENTDTDVKILDNTEACVCALDFVPRLPHKHKSQFNFIAAASWAKRYSHPIHRKLIKNRIGINTNNIDTTLKIVQESDKIIETMLMLLEKDLTFNDWDDFQIETIKSVVSQGKKHELIDSFIHKLSLLPGSIDTIIGDKFYIRLDNLAKGYADLQVSLEPKEVLIFDAIRLIEDARDLLNELGGGNGFQLNPLLQKIPDTTALFKSRKHAAIYGYGLYGRLLVQLINVFDSLKVDFIIDDNPDIGDDSKSAIPIISSEVFCKNHSGVDTVFLCTASMEFIKHMKHNLKGYNCQIVDNLFIPEETTND
jgi:hypothetical protein